MRALVADDRSGDALTAYQRTRTALAERLGACPRLRILATSREPLGLTGEAVWPVQPLALPPPGAGPAQARESAAIRLLTDRALAAAPGLIFDDRTIAAAAARICRALDGIPLAIELAAARLRTLSPAQLADRLDDRFRLLTNGSRTALPRHQTLRATVDWSWNLLEPAECVLLRRLAYFSGGVSLAAATAHAEFITALDLGLASGAAPVIARAMVGLADLALAGGDPDRAAELLGTAAAVRGGEDGSLPDPGRVAAAGRRPWRSALRQGLRPRPPLLPD